MRRWWVGAVALSSLFSACVVDTSQEDPSVSDLRTVQCSASPNPALLNVNVTVSASGLQAGRLATIEVTDSGGVRSKDVTASSTGTASAIFSARVLGTASVRVLGRRGQRTVQLSTCSFSVVSIMADGGVPDSGTPDTGTPDAGTDGGTEAGTDTGTPDGGTDGGTDTGTPDGGTDGGTDTGTPDGGTDGGTDTGTPDSGGTELQQITGVTIDSPARATLHFSGVSVPSATGPQAYALKIRDVTANETAGWGCTFWRDEDSVPMENFIPSHSYETWIRYCEPVGGGWLGNCTDGPITTFAMPPLVAESVPPIAYGLARVIQFTDMGPREVFVVHASDATGLDRIDFFANGALSATFHMGVDMPDGFEPGWPMQADSYRWAVVPPELAGASYTLEAVAYDLLGNTTELTVLATSDAIESEVVALVNQRRAAGASCGAAGTFGSAPTLTVHAALATAARNHSIDMATNNYFSHDSLDGRTFAQRIAEAGYVGSFVGENIAAGDTTASAVVATWMASPGHCANIMHPAFRFIGIGYAYSVNSDYGAYWTMDLGAP